MNSYSVLINFKLHEQLRRLQSCVDYKDRNFELILLFRVQTSRSLEERATDDQR